MTHLVSCSPDGKGVAKITGDYTRYPGRTCRYDNGVEGECLLEHKCSKEEQEISGYNSTWKCPKHMDMYRNYRICCPFLGKENLQEGGGKTLSNSKKLCWTVVNSLLPSVFLFGLVQYLFVLLSFFKPGRCFKPPLTARGGGEMSPCLRSWIRTYRRYLIGHHLKPVNVWISSAGIVLSYIDFGYVITRRFR